MLRLARCLLIAVPCCVLSPLAGAYSMSGDTGMSLSIGAGSYLLSQQTLSSAARSAGARPKAASGRSAASPSRATLFAPTRSSAGLDTLAAVYPDASRAQVRQHYQQLLGAYPQVARQLGLPLNDVASAMASFLAGSYMAFHNRSLDDRAVKPLANQLRQALADEPGFARLGDADKQNLYDQMAMLGMMMAVTQSQLAQQPDARVAADLREVGRQFLEGMLQVGADRVRLTTAGLGLD